LGLGSKEKKMNTLDYEINLFEDKIKEIGFNISSIKKYKKKDETYSICMWIKRK
jgi:hypothetical protein